MRSLLRLLFVLVLSVLLISCSGRGTTQSLPQDAPVTQQNTDDAMGLIAPWDALANTADRTSSELLLDRNGSDFVVGLSKWVEAEDTSATFSPKWRYRYPVRYAAYAIYRFNVEGYSGDEEIVFGWGVEPVDYANLWIGLSNWSNDSWDWHPGSNDGILDLRDEGFVDHTEPGTGDMLVAVVLTGYDEVRLDWLQVENTSTEPVIVTGITPDPTEHYSGHDMAFDVQLEHRQDDSITFQWDFNGGATPNNPIVQNPIVTLGDAGTYNCSVIVDNDHGEPDTFEFSMSVLDAGPGNWHMFGHDAQRTRQSPYVGAQTNNVKWEYTSGGAVASSPAIGFDGTLYVGSYDHYLYAINPDGTEKWSYDTDDYIYSSPAIGANGTIYVVNYAGSLIAIQPDGVKKWSRAVAHTTSPAIGSDGTIYLSGKDDQLYAFNANGDLEWSFTARSDVRCSPAIGVDGTVYVQDISMGLYAINPDGSEKWIFTTDGTIYSSPAIGIDGTIYVGSLDNNLYAVNPDGTEKWTYTTEAAIQSSPAIGTDGTVFVGGDDHYLYAFNGDGSLKWKFDTGDHVLSSPAVDANGTVYVGNHSNKVFAINPDGSVLWSYTTGDWVSSSPAVGSDGTVYVGSNDGKLYAFGS